MIVRDILFLETMGLCCIFNQLDELSKFPGAQTRCKTVPPESENNPDPCSQLLRQILGLSRLELLCGARIPKDCGCTCAGNEEPVHCHHGQATPPTILQFNHNNPISRLHSTAQYVYCSKVVKVMEREIEQSENAILASFREARDELAGFL